MELERTGRIRRWWWWHCQGGLVSHCPRFALSHSCWSTMASTAAMAAFSSRNRRSRSWGWRSTSRGKLDLGLRGATHSALCCYPNVNGSVRNLSLNTFTAPIFLQFNYFRENIWVIIWVQFHFLYIFVGRVDRIHKTSHTRMLSFYFFASDLQCFGDELNVSSKTAPANI